MKFQGFLNCLRNVRDPTFWHPRECQKVGRCEIAELSSQRHLPLKNKMVLVQGWSQPSSKHLHLYFDPFIVPKFLLKSCVKEPLCGGAALGNEGKVIYAHLGQRWRKVRSGSKTGGKTCTGDRGRARRRGPEGQMTNSNLYTSPVPELHKY